MFKLRHFQKPNCLVLRTAPARYQPVQVGVGSSQSVGKVRDHNEDTLFTFHSILADGGQDLPFGLFIVADGMGGHQHGEVASGTAIKSGGGCYFKPACISHFYPHLQRTEMNQSMN